MSQIHAAIRAFLDGERGATMIEYSVMVSLIAAVCVVIVTTIGGQTNGLFTALNAAWTAA